MIRLGLTEAVLVLLFAATVAVRTGAIASGDVGGHVLAVATLPTAVGVAVILIFGACLMMAKHRSLGRTMLIIGGALAVALFTCFTVYNYFHGPRAFGGSHLGVVVGLVLLGGVPAVATLLCAAATPGHNSAGQPA